MPELSGAVARVQLTRLQAVVDRRRRHARRLSAALAHLPGLTTPAPAGIHAYWYYPLLADGLDHAGLRRFAAALAAEGVPCVAGYIARPLYQEPVLRQPTAYGGSGYPIRGRIEYPDGECPGAEALVSERLLVIPWDENYTAEQVDEIGRAACRARGEVAVGDGTMNTR